VLARLWLQVNIMDAAAPCLLAYSLSGRVVGRLYG
jgi:hypothetical protein